MLIIGFVLLERLPRESAWNKRKIALTLLAGAALGAAITVEFTAAIAVAILIVYYAAQGFTSRSKPRATALGVLAIGATIGLMQIPLLIYNNAIFGSPFHLGYSNVVGFNGMKSGFSALTLLIRLRCGKSCSASIAAWSGFRPCSSSPLWPSAGD